MVVGAAPPVVDPAQARRGSGATFEADARGAHIRRTMAHRALCAPIDTGDTSVESTMGIGDLQVEAVDLAAADPDAAVVWHGSVRGLGAHGYRSTAGLSARLAADGTVWAIVTGGGDVETPTRTFVLHGSASVEITRDGYAAFAFDPADLIYPWDVLPGA